MLEFLPDKLSLDGTYEEMLQILYNTFENDIKTPTFRLNNLPIVFDNRKIDSPFEEGFWHIITRGKEDRLIDYKRAKRLPWLRPMIENISDSGLLVWIEYDYDRRGKKVKKTYIWYRDGRYIIILKEIPKKYYLTTAFYVNGARNDKYYFRKYEKA